MTRGRDIAIARIYDDPDTTKGARVLVDRLWPRGVTRTDARLDDWNRDVAPSDALRKWFGHDPDRWDEFRRRYRAELDAMDAPVADLLDRVRMGPVTLLYGARDTAHNQAVVLRDYLAERSEKEAGDG